MSAIMTPRGLLRQTTLLQGATNSVAQFVRIVLKILQDHLPHRALPFIDDIGIKGPRSDFGQVEVEELPGVRLFVLLHLQNIDQVLADIERSGTTLAATKCKFCITAGDLGLSAKTKKCFFQCSQLVKSAGD
jgi:hypothetical protein